MSTLPATGGFVSFASTEAAQNLALEEMRDCQAEAPGGGPETTLTIASGVIAPGNGAARMFSIDTEGGAGTDDLTNITTTEVPDGAQIYIRAANAGRVVTVKHAAGGAGQFSLYRGVDVVLDSTSEWLILKRNGSSIEEVGRLSFDGGPRVVITATGAVTLREQDSGALVNNLGASADVVVTLPAAAKGLFFEWHTFEAFKIKALCGAGDKIRKGATAYTAAGNIESSAAVDNGLFLTALDATHWGVTQLVGSWTPT